MDRGLQWLQYRIGYCMVGCQLESISVAWGSMALAVRSSDGLYLNAERDYPIDADANGILDPEVLNWRIAARASRSDADVKKSIRFVCASSCSRNRAALVFSAS